MIITLITNFVIKKSICDRMKQCLGADEQTIIKPIRLFGNVDIRAMNEDVKSDLCVVWLNFSELYPQYIQDLLISDDVRGKIIEDCVYRVKKLFEVISPTTKETFFVTFEDFANPIWRVTNPGELMFDIIYEINIHIKQLMNSDFPTIFCVDSKHVAAFVGTSNIFSSKDYYRWAVPYSEKYMLAMVDAIEKLYEINHRIAKKCIVLDCDNVLWGGILNEKGINGISLDNQGSGKVYSDFQRFLKLLYHSGMLLAVCSKNEEQDVMEVFENHSGMILKKEDIAVFEVNWRNKAENIRNIATFLNISLESMVFIDDNESEVGMVNKLLPEVTGILFEKDVIYQKMDFLRVKCGVSQKTIESRMNSFRHKKKQDEIRKASSCQDEYLRLLEVESDIRIAQDSEYKRIAELSQRTNKFNYGNRYSYGELLDMVHHDKLNLYSVYVKDKFCEHGLVGAIGLFKDGTVKICCLSCRVLGYGMEEKMKEFIRQEGGDEDVINAIKTGTYKDEIQ